METCLALWSIQIMLGSDKDVRGGVLSRCKFLPYSVMLNYALHKIS